MIKSSKLVIGTVQFGLDYGIHSAGRPDRAAVVDILNLASDSGIDVLDTSAAYGDSEVVLGQTMSKAGGGFRIVSKYPKCDRPVAEVLAQSLSNLGVTSIYGYLLHHFEVYKSRPDLWREFEAVKENGLVRKIGFSLYSPSELELVLERGDAFDLVQFPYNIFDRQFEPYLPKLKEMGVEIHVRSTFLQGLFFMDPAKLPERLTPLAPYIAALHQYAAQNGLTVAQVAMNYNLQNEYIDGVLIGVDNCDQLRENISTVTEQSINFTVNVMQRELLNPVNWK